MDWAPQGLYGGYIRTHGLEDECLDNSPAWVEVNSIVPAMAELYKKKGEAAVGDTGSQCRPDGKPRSASAGSSIETASTR